MLCPTTVLYITANIVPRISFVTALGASEDRVLSPGCGKTRDPGNEVSLQQCSFSEKIAHFMFDFRVLTGNTPHQDKPDASICPQFLVGRCDKGSACTELHCSLPFHWQYKVSLFDEWKCFTDEDNLAVEKMYCDENVGTLVNFKPAQPPAL